MNALTLLKQDHQNVEGLFRQFEQLADDAAPSDKRRIVDHVIEQLSVHAAIEELHFYPTVRECSGETLAAVLEGLEEHHVVKWTLAELARMSPTDERFDAKVKVLSEIVLHHAEEEERDLFPLVRDALTVEQLEKLGETMETAKKTAPTRPHPRLPDTPPGNLITLPFAMIDKAVRTGREAVESVLSRR